jgi:putative peptidoglycan lipid II flippase
MGRLYLLRLLRSARPAHPLRFAVLRVAVTTVLGYYARSTPHTGSESILLWGVAGLTASAGVAGWIEFCATPSRAEPQARSHAIVRRFIGKAVAGGGDRWAVGTAVRFAPLPGVPLIPAPIIRASVTLGIFGVVYLAASATFADEARRLLRRLTHP